MPGCCRFAIGLLMGNSPHIQSQRGGGVAGGQGASLNRQGEDEEEVPPEEKGI